MKQAKLWGGVAAAALIGLIYWFYQSQYENLPVNKSPEQYALLDQMETSGAFDFSLPRLDGTDFQFSSVRGKIVILNFWASWCNPCVEEFPSLLKLVEEGGGDVVLVAVSADENKEDMTNFLKAFGQQKPYMEVVWDRERKVADQFGVDKIPETFIFGRDMKLIRKVLGISNWYTEDARSYFQQLRALKEE